MLLFRSEDHVVGPGAFMTPAQMWRLADAWYHDRAEAGWRRRTPEEAEAVLGEIGLTGDFWKLRP